MKKLKLKSTKFGAQELLTRTQLSNIFGGDGSGIEGSSATLSCGCMCNSGIGTQPSYITTITNFDFTKDYVPSAESCGCSTLMFTAQPGYNGGSCTRIFNA